MRTPDWDAQGAEIEMDADRINQMVVQLIRGAMQERGWRQRHLAKAIGVDEGYISAALSPRRAWRMSFRTAAKLLRPLGYRLTVGIERIPS